MIAITSGLNTPPIRRLKRTWEQVNQRCMAQFGACEMTIDSNKNFTKYRQLMASVTPPCVPFIGNLLNQLYHTLTDPFLSIEGVFLSTLQFIQDGNPDMLPGGLVNFRKRQKASEVINDIKRWQAQPFNFIPIPAVLSYIEESLGQFSDTRASSEHFWALSLEREPREREDEKMARLLQESGFL
jgi:son of sevenless-like protein